jgi:hypothetical protein
MARAEGTARNGTGGNGAYGGLRQTSSLFGS